MINTLLGTKAGMVSSYDARGRRVGATVVKIEPNFVTQIKTEESKDGYSAVQLGMGTKKSTKKPQIGHAKKAGFDKKVRWLREVKIKNQISNIKNEITSTSEDLKPGQQISLNQVFFIGDEVKVTGTSKGRGFAGGVKRHGFHGGPKTHGQSDRHRAPGSIGQGTTPGRVYKGKKMAGHMGVDTVSYRGLEVVGVNKEENLLSIKGGIPGPVGGLVIIEKLGRIKGYTPPPEEKEEEESPENSENSESQNVSGSENQKSDISDKSDASGLLSNSESSEKKEGE